MKASYLETIAGLLARAYPKLATTHRLEFKNVFGAVGGYVNGCIFASCGKFGATFDAGIRDLCRAAEPDGVFCYTFFKGVGAKPS